jgi:hypothetical protein
MHAGTHAADHLREAGALFAAGIPSIKEKGEVDAGHESPDAENNSRPCVLLSKKEQDGGPDQTANGPTLQLLFDDITKGLHQQAWSHGGNVSRRHCLTAGLNITVVHDFEIHRFRLRLVCGLPVIRFSRHDGSGFGRSDELDQSDRFGMDFLDLRLFERFAFRRFQERADFIYAGVQSSNVRELFEVRLEIRQGG